MFKWLGRLFFRYDKARIDERQEPQLFQAPQPIRLDRPDIAHEPAPPLHPMPPPEPPALAVPIWLAQMPRAFAVVDVETTGLHAHHDPVVALAIVIVPNSAELLGAGVNFGACGSRAGDHRAHVPHGRVRTAACSIQPL